MGSKSKDNNTKKGKRPANTSHAAIDESGKGKRTEKNIINDSRFAALHSDPRFREPPQKKSKVTIDSRFNRMFTDKNFTSSIAPTDIRGKPRNKSSSNNPLNHYYHIQEEEEATEEEDGEKHKRQKEKSKPITSPLIKKINANLGNSDEQEEEEESDSESGTSEEEIEDLKLKKVVVASSESEEDEELESDDSLASTEDSDSDSDDESDEVSSEEEDTFMQKEDVPEIDKETKRLAVVNMDWGRVKAVDLYVLLNSLLPKGGQIISVAVYPSDFGLKRMEEEAVNGPIGLFDDENEKGEDSDDEDEDDDDDEIDNKKLRAYEMSRLRYYYAVVECDSIATADYLYKTCDGVEFERTSNKLDLRFIPDSMEFKHQPRDIATEAPADYEGLDFHTRALQHSNIELTWDEDEPQRIRTLKRQFNDEQLADLELKEFLASDESESDASDEGDDTEDKSAKRKKKQDTYRALLQSGEGSDGNNEDDDQDMEVTFNTGLEDLSKRILEKKDKQSETVWEAYLRKKKEKKKSRKGNSKDSSEDESSDSDQEPIEESEDFFIDEPSAKGDKSTRKRKQSLEASKEAEASRAELELLLADDKAGDANLKGYNMKPKRSKGKKGKEIPVEDKLPSIDYEDPRFSSLFKSPLFALDPTDPQFKRSAAYARQLAQKQHKAEEGIVKEKQQLGIAAPLQPSRTLEAVTSEKLQSDDLPLRKEKHELSSLVKSIKMKSQQLSLPSQGKVVGKNEKSRASAKKIDEERGIEENEKSRATAKKDGKRRK